MQFGVAELLRSFAKKHTIVFIACFLPKNNLYFSIFYFNKSSSISNKNDAFIPP